MRFDFDSRFAGNEIALAQSQHAEGLPGDLDVGLLLQLFVDDEGDYFRSGDHPIASGIQYAKMPDLLP